MARRELARAAADLNRNTQEALVRALLLRAEVVVHLEDDTVPSPDAVRYFDWAKIKAQYRRTRRELFPVLSRIQNIGYDLGENGRTAEWYRANHRAQWVAGRLEDGEFSFPLKIAA